MNCHEIVIIVRLGKYYFNDLVLHRKISLNILLFHFMNEQLFPTVVFLVGNLYFANVLSHDAGIYVWASFNGQMNSTIYGQHIRVHTEGGI